MRTRLQSINQLTYEDMAGRNIKQNEIQRYQAEVGSGGWSIKIMTLGLIVGTAWFAHILQERGRLPWQHNDRVRAIMMEMFRHMLRVPRITGRNPTCHLHLVRHGPSWSSMA